ncbi:hypothetical protein PROFUN_16309, partial [Planoprotostelium fungivorum]
NCQSILRKYINDCQKMVSVIIVLSRILHICKVYLQLNQWSGYNSMFLLLTEY